MSTVKSIMYKPTRSPGHDVGYQRVPLNEALLIAGYGIEGDHKGGNPKRNLNVMDDVTLAELQAEGYPTDPGTLGENIILAGIDLRTLRAGSQLHIGDAIIELDKPRVPCEQLTPIDARMPDTVVQRVGIMCRVVQSGRIRVGDRVEVVIEPALRM